MTIANPTQVRQLPPPEEQEFSVFEPRIQELGEKDRLAWQAQAQAQQEKNQAWQAQQERSNMQSEHTAVVSKRPAIEFDGREKPHSKRRKEEESQVEEITLEDSDEEQDKAVRVNAATREPGPSQGHQAGHHSSSNTCLTQTQTPAALARLKSLPITVVGEVALSTSGTDSEDDIQVTVIKKM